MGVVIMEAQGRADISPPRKHIHAESRSKEIPVLPSVQSHSALSPVSHNASLKSTRCARVFVDFFFLRCE